MGRQGWEWRMVGAAPTPGCSSASMPSSLRSPMTTHPSLPLPHAYHGVLLLIVSPGKADSNEDSQNAIRKVNFLATKIT